MDANKLLILAKQKAHLVKGQNFYVTKQGIKRDFNLLGAKYIYKVYFKNGLYVEDNKGDKIEKPEKVDKSESRATRKAGGKKTSVSRELREFDAEAVGEDAE